MIQEIINNNDLLLEVYKDIAQPGVRKLGLALETVFELSSTILLPIKLLNEKAKINFEHNLKKYVRRIECINESDIISIPPEIGIPVIDLLTYYTNEEISDLFVNLLVTSTSRYTTKYAHPSYIKIIQNISVDEARIIEYISKTKKKTIPFIYYRANVLGKNPEKDFVRDMNTITGIENMVDLLFPENLEAYIENLVSCNILSLIDGFSDPECSKDYMELKANYLNYYEEFNKRISELDIEFETTKVKYGFYRLTSYGEGFIQACFKEI